MPWEAIYVAGGLVLAGYYIPQLQTCARDTDDLRAYSMPKAVMQLGCRAVMMPFVWITVDSKTMLAIQTLDIALRTAELSVAFWALRRQGWSWSRIAARATHRPWRTTDKPALVAERG